MLASSNFPHPRRWQFWRTDPAAIAAVPLRFVRGGKKLDFDLPAKGGETIMAAGAASGGSVMITLLPISSLPSSAS